MRQRTKRLLLTTLKSYEEISMTQKEHIILNRWAIMY